MATRFLIDTAHSSIEFSVRHLVIAKVYGRFTSFTGVVDIDPLDISHSVVTAEIEAASVSTNDDRRDAHLRSAEFLDANRFPVLAFTSRRIERKRGRLSVSGPLALHGVTRDVAFDVEQLGATKDPAGSLRVAFSARGAIDRKDFGLVWSQVLAAGGALVGDKVAIAIEIQAVNAEAHDQATRMIINSPAGPAVA